MNEIVDREELKSNILKAVILRVDYEDIIEISSDTIKEIKRLFPNGDLRYRMLNSMDFTDNDLISIRSVPIEVVEKTKCFGIIFDEGLVLEFNQFFLRVVKTVKDYKYSTFENEILDNFISLYKVLSEREGIEEILRVSIKKINETFFDSLNKARQCIQKEVLMTSSVEKNICFKSLYKYSTNNNFTYKNSNVNLGTRFEKVKHREKYYFRFYMDIENYLIDCKKEEINKEKILQLNDNGFDIFLKVLKRKSIELLKNGQGVGKYELN